MKLEDIQFDEIYFCQDYANKNNNFICLFKENDASPFVPDITNPHFNKRFSTGLFYKHHITRLATPKEKHWLQWCILANKYVEYEEAMKHYVEPIVVNKEFIKDFELDEILIKLLNL